MARTGSSEKDDSFIGAQDQDDTQDSKEMEGQWSEKELRMVIVGRTGSGISSLGNHILQKACFNSKRSLQSVTKKSSRGEASRNGKTICVVETPGLYNTSFPKDYIEREIIKSLSLVAPGPHAVLYVCRVGRHSEEELQSLKWFSNIFGDDVFKYTVVVFSDIKTKLDDEDTRFGTENEIRIVLIGRTGNGKSATGNSILNKKGYFPSTVSSQSITHKCQKGERGREGKKVIVVDSPGLFDTKELSENVKKEITKCIAVSSPGPHAILYVLSCRNRFTKEEEDTFYEMITIFGDNLYKHIIFVFTALDDIHADNKTFEEFLKGSEGVIKILLRKCENRVLAFNNRVSDDAENERQLKPLFDMITKMKGKAAQFYYQHKMIEETENMIREEMKRIIEEKNKKGEKYDEVDIRTEIRSQIRDDILREESIFDRIKAMLFSKYFVAFVGGTVLVGAAVIRACTVM